MRIVVLLIVMCVTWPLFAKPLKRVTRQADGCVATPIACNTTSRGRLSAGDCTSEDGTYFDLYQFNGSVDTFVEVLVRPLSPTMTNPGNHLIGPPGSDVLTPIVAGGREAESRYILPGSGTWGIAAFTLDLFGSGEYAIDLRCRAGRSTSRDCVSQPIQCGQLYVWSLTAESCRFSNADKAFASLEFTGAPGYPATGYMESAQFSPNVVFWSESLGNYVSGGIRISNSATETRYFIPDSGRYSLVASSVEAQRGGEFGLALQCSFLPPCLRPLIVDQPTRITIPYGTSTSLSVESNGTGPLSYTWYESGFFLAGTDQTFTTPPLTNPTSYLVEVRNACGMAQSKVIDVSLTGGPPVPLRRRPAKR